MYNTLIIIVLIILSVTMSWFYIKKSKTIKDLTLELHEKKQTLQKYTDELQKVSSDKLLLKKDLDKHFQKLQEIEKLRDELLKGLSIECKKNPLSKECIPEYELIHALRLLNRTENEIVNAYKTHYTVSGGRNIKDVNEFLDSAKSYFGQDRISEERMIDELNRARQHTLKSINSTMQTGSSQKLDDRPTPEVEVEVKVKRSKPFPLSVCDLDLEPIIEQKILPMVIGIHLRHDRNVTTDKKARDFVFSIYKIIQHIKDKYCKKQMSIADQTIMINEIFDTVITILTNLRRGTTLQVFNILNTIDKIR